MESNNEQQKTNPSIEDLGNLITGKLKEMDSLKDQLLGNVQNLTAKEKKKIKIAGKEASVSINGHGIVFLEFSEKGGGQEFFNSLS